MTSRLTCTQEEAQTKEKTKDGAEIEGEDENDIINEAKESKGKIVAWRRSHHARLVCSPSGLACPTGMAHGHSSCYSFVNEAFVVKPSRITKSLACL
ncbi:hypothetical protein PDIG_42980 [Penicillium digitatum PHI26]|uniref:Uncharacterized protein n=2 Tax=Penicillium digitatum TaxID=36651 RepID=K9FVX1_PEND2|nr:hypothetical protein PDIP_41560 [Penicillium digitatum Pd1]EKV12697.1 hypothetical protein PDIG_42980 [Penicillium digitatum PHI26]EKV15097.1 hypothetical protein PDIP_41560 [Penicillium digitatum Pd1]